MRGRPHDIRGAVRGFFSDAGPVVVFAGISLGQLTGSPYFDGGASIVIGLILGGAAIWLAYETKGLLIRESTNPEIVRGIREIARKMQDVKHVSEGLTMHIGPEFSW